MSKTIVKIDLSESPYKDQMIHNRWHPDVPIIQWIKPGEDFVVETYDWTGGFIKNNESADDVRRVEQLGSRGYIQRKEIREAQRRGQFEPRTSLLLHPNR
jgi:hypothetical protein